MAGTSALGIMSADTFASRTKSTKAVNGFASRFKSRGSNMNGIDRALQAWEKNCDSTRLAAAQKLALVRRIEYECNRWLDRKRGKSSRLANYRRQTIEELTLQCRKAAQLLTGKVKAQAGRLYSTKGLDTGYTHERQHYEELGKATNPYAAGAVKNVGTLSYDDYKEEAESDPDDIVRVYYLNRAQRMQYMAYIEGGLFYDDDGLIHAEIGLGLEDRVTRVRQKTATARMYAVDRNGNLFTKHIAGFDGTYFNHSSFCAGREILCAGTALWFGGELKYISNHSGHYKPSPSHLQNYLLLLAEEDVEVDNVCVNIKVGNAEKCFQGSTFIASLNAATDWPYKDANGVYVMHEGQRVLVAEPQG